MEVPNFVLFCIRQCRNSDRKVLPSLGLGKDFPVEQHKPCKDYRSELQMRNSSHLGKLFFRFQELRCSILSHHANELIEYCYNSSPFLLVLDR